MFFRIAAAAGDDAGGDGGRFSIGGGEPLGAQAVLDKVAEEVLLRQHGEKGGDELVVVVHAPAVVWMPRNASARHLQLDISERYPRGGNATSPPVSPPRPGSVRLCNAMETDLPNSLSLSHPAS